MTTVLDSSVSPDVNLGEIDIEGHGELTGHGEGSVVTHRPTDVYLQNDGVLQFWMQPNWHYTISYDRIGWVVSARAWPPDGHTYRLASAGRLVDWLPLGNGRFMLDAAARYELVPAGGSWELHEIR